MLSGKISEDIFIVPAFLSLIDRHYLFWHCFCYSVGECPMGTKQDSKNKTSKVYEQTR